ncbi:hypothetical protein HY605_01055 [Candidatus Peregrinibacteria bacterium]|nr:hypothetical protein [Candidatus Peregrinibacteria bacterium]
MWFERYLIRLGNPPEALGPVVPGKKQEGEALDVNNLADQPETMHDSERRLHGSNVAVNNSETSEVQERSVFDGIKEFNRRFEDLQAKFSGVEKLDLKERKEVILSMRRRIMELKFLISYLRETALIEVMDGHDVYVEAENLKLDLTAKRKEIGDIERKLFEIKAVDNEVELRLYENLEQTRDNIKVRDFLKLPLADRLKLISNIKSWDDLKQEALLVFDFGKNRALKYQIGLGDLMPPEIRGISLSGNVYERRANQGFYLGGRYLAIFTGTKVKVEVVDKDYASKNEAEYAKKFGADYKANENLEGRELARSEVFDTARSFGVDAYLLEAVLSQVRGDDANAINDDYEFLHIAARYVQNAEARFGAGAMEGDHYGLKFIAYTLDHFNLFNEYSASIMNFDAVAKKYASLRGFEFKPEEKNLVEKFRQAERPKTMKEIEQMGGRANYHGEIAYSAVDLSHGSEEMKRRMEQRLKIFEAALNAGDVPEKYRSGVLAKARAVYEMMIGRMGTAYKGMVGIRRPEGGIWNINNNCVGHAMKVMENTGFRLLRGKQAGKQAANFYWGPYRDGSRDFGGHFSWLRSMISSEQDLVDVHVTPENCDSLVGQHLAVGECAPAGLWNHALWLYKDVNGVVMTCHSGADVRPRRIPATGEMPPGYKQVGSNYVKLSGSKVNEVPLSYFLSKTQKNYAPPRNSLKFVPLTKLFMGNVSGMPMA